MQAFLAIVSSFPTILYSILLGVVVLYWLSASLGLLDINSLDGDVADTGGFDQVTLPGVDIHTSSGSELHHIHATDTEGITGLSGLLLKLGLNGVPITIVITCLVLYGWITCYFILLFASPVIGTDGWIHYVLGIPIFFSTLLVSVPLSAKTIKPLRRIFAITQNKTSQTLLGKIGIIRSPKVTATFGEVNVDDGGAGLILKVRAREPNDFKRGDRIVLIQFIESEHAYNIISEENFTH